MGLSLKIDVIEEKGSCTVLDCTGLFSYDNKGGYGVQNPRVEDVSSSFLEVFPPSLPKGSEPYKIDVLAYLPTISDVGFEVIPLKVGQVNGEMESGKWKFNLVIAGRDKKGKAFNYTASVVKIFTKSVECCVDKLSPHINSNILKDEKQKQATILNNLLEGVFRQIGCGLYDKADETIKYIKSQCQCCGCNT